MTRASRVPSRSNTEGALVSADSEQVRFSTADGIELEGEIVLPPNWVGAVVLCHPHPAQGGSMRSLVTSELFRILPLHDVAVLRFNFRGVEGSGGTHAGGLDEHRDVEAAVDALVARCPEPAPILAGWSFGADVSLTVLDERVSGWFLIAPPLRVLPPEAFLAAHDPRAKVLVVPEHDQFNPPGSAALRSADWANSRIEIVVGADHFLAGRTDRVAELLLGFLDDLTDRR